MNTKLIGSQAVKLLSKLTGQVLTLHDITPQVLLMADLIALLKGVIHADAKVSEDEVTQFKATLGKLNLNNKQTFELSKLLYSGIHKYNLHSEIDDFLILLVPLSEAEKLLLFGLGYRMAIADSSLDASESKYLRDLGKRLEIESRYLDVLESSFGGKSYNVQDFKDVCELVDPARFHNLGTVFVNAADDLLTALNKLIKTEAKEPQNATSSIALVSGEYQKLQDFQVQKQTLLKRINHLFQLIDGGIKESLLPITFRDEIQAIKDKLESQRFRVAVIGDFSQGKSTLLNALLGEEIQPVRAIPCSGTLSVLKYGDLKRVICRYRDGNEQEIAVEDYQKKAAISKEAALNNRSEELLKSNIAEIVFEHPNLLLCRNGVEIVDSPGLNEHPDRTRVTEELLKNTDAILFMTNANKLLTQGERDIITRIKEREGDLSLENLFLVVNFMDNLDTDEDREDVQIAANSIIKDGSITGKDRIHFVSAKSALKATLSNTSNEYLVSFQNFTRTLEAFLTDERGALILQSTTQKIDELTSKCIKKLEVDIQNLDNSLDESDKKDILEQIGQASGRFVSIRKEVEIRRDEAFPLALDSWNQYKVVLKEDIFKSVEKWKTVHNPIFSRDGVVHDYAAEFSARMQKGVNVWATYQLNHQILSPALIKLDANIKKQLDALNTSIVELDEKIGTNFSADFQPAFRDFDTTYVAGFAAGGVGVGGGAAAAAFFLIPALALGPAIIIGVLGAALLGGGFGAFAMTDAYKQIGNQICQSGFTELNKAEESVTAKIKEAINDQFMERAVDSGKLIKQIISELENRLEQEDIKNQNIDTQKVAILAKKQEFEKSLSI